MLCLILTMSGMRLRAQTLEPISTKFADPLARGEGILRIGYEYAHFSSSVSGQLIPLLANAERRRKAIRWCSAFLRSIISITTPGGWAHMKLLGAGGEQEEISLFAR